MKPLYLIVMLAISTGARKSEILTCKWENVDFERKIITIHETKNNESRALFLFDTTLQLLQEYAKQQKELTGYVFHPRAKQTPINIEREWKKAIKQVRLDNFRFHDLRHTTASYLAMNGATPNDIAEILGHKSLNMVKRYAHLCKTHTAKVVRDMCEEILIA